MNLNDAIPHSNDERFFKLETLHSNFNPSIEYIIYIHHFIYNTNKKKLKFKLLNSKNVNLSLILVRNKINH